MEDKYTFSTLAFMKDKIAQSVGVEFELNSLHVYTWIFYST